MVCYIFGVHQQFTTLPSSTQVEKDSGAEGEEEIGDSKETLRIIL